MCFKIQNNSHNKPSQLGAVTMFAARLFSLTLPVAPAFTSAHDGRKNHWRASRNITITAVLVCLLNGLTSLAIAEDAAPKTNDTTSPPMANMAEKNNETGKPKGHVARAIFTSAIVDREPVDNLTTVSGDTNRVFFFSDLRGLAGQIVTHRWEYDGKVMAEVTFKVGNGARWRVYSSKNLLPEWTGQWTVVVSNESGQPLESSMFEYSAATSAATSTVTTGETTTPVSP
jgi:hypothetical protein